MHTTSVSLLACNYIYIYLNDDIYILHTDLKVSWHFPKCSNGGEAKMENPMGTDMTNNSFVVVEPAGVRPGPTSSTTSPASSAAQHPSFKEVRV
jgi:hypothetical protein